jgi:hypothetical protein
VRGLGLWLARRVQGHLHCYIDISIASSIDGHSMVDWLIALLHRRLVAASRAFAFTVWCWGLVLGSGVGVWCWGLVLGSGVGVWCWGFGVAVASGWRSSTTSTAGRGGRCRGSDESSWSGREGLGSMNSSGSRRHHQRNHRSHVVAPCYVTAKLLLVL